jgi:hypothetical protein
VTSVVVVATANHYWLDVVAGAALVGAVIAGVALVGRAKLTSGAPGGPA